MRKLLFLNFYNLPGEGVVAEFDNGEETVLFDIQGLQYQIIEYKKNGMDSSEEERILSRMKSLAPSGVTHFEEKFL